MHPHRQNSPKLNYRPIFVSDDFINHWSHMMEEHLFNHQPAIAY